MDRGKSRTTAWCALIMLLPSGSQHHQQQHSQQKLMSSGATTGGSGNRINFQLCCHTCVRVAERSNNTIMHIQSSSKPNTETTPGDRARFGAIRRRRRLRAHFSKSINRAGAHRGARSSSGCHLLTIRAVQNDTRCFFLVLLLSFAPA